MPPKLSKKELEEQEALKLAEELKKKQEEELRIQQEEMKKYDIIKLSTGLNLILTNYCIETIWKHSNPKQFMMEFICKQFERLNILQNFDNFELETTADFHLFNMVFAKDHMNLDDQKTMVLMNLLWDLLKHNNQNYKESASAQAGQSKDQQSKKQNQQQLLLLQDDDSEMIKSRVIKTNDEKKLSLKNKSAASDFENLKQILLNHSIQNQPSQIKYFNIEEVKEIINYVKNGYISHFNLYYYVLTNQRQVEEKKQMCYIDQPLEILPLNQAHEIEIKKDDEEPDYRQEIELKLQKEEEIKQQKLKEQAEQEEILRKQEEERLDPLTESILAEKIKEAELYMQAQLEERSKQLQQKFENLTAGTVKKK